MRICCARKLVPECNDATAVLPRQYIRCRCAEDARSHAVSMTNLRSLHLPDFDTYSRPLTCSV